jgi:hypothetical protein
MYLGCGIFLKKKIHFIFFNCEIPVYGWWANRILAKAQQILNFAQIISP